MYVSIFVIIILLGIILLLQWKRIHSKKEVPSHKKKNHIESSQKEITLEHQIDILGRENAHCKQIICELENELSNVKDYACISKKREKEHCEMISKLQNELEKNKKRLYSIEISLNKAEYDKHQLEMEILRYKEG